MSLDLESIANTFFQQNLGPGINLALYEKGVWISYSKGLAGDGNILANSDIYYDIASLTKTVTATQILLLIQQNSLGLNDQAGEFLSFLKGFKVSIRDLLCHCSGLRHITPIEKNREYSINEIDSILFKAENLEQVENYKTKYTDLGYVYLGKIIEKITNLDLAQNLSNFLEKYELSGIIYNPYGLCIAPSEKSLKLGVCMDEKARFAAGFSGHAGLFASLNGLKWYCQAWLSNSFNLGKNLWHSSFNPQNRNLGDRAENYGFVWRLGYLSKFPNHSGYTGSSIFLDFKSQRALVYNCNYTFPYRDLSKRTRFIEFGQYVGRLFEQV